MSIERKLNFLKHLKEKINREWLTSHIHGIANFFEEALYGVVLENTATDGVITEQQGQKVADFVRRLHDLAATDTTRVDFWRRPVDWADFVREITVALIEDDMCAADQAAALADALFEVIKANRSRIPRPDAARRDAADLGRRRSMK